MGGCVPVSFITLQHTATRRNTLQHTATHCNTLQHTATHCNTFNPTLLRGWLCACLVYHTATHCNTPQHTATHCNTLQHTATHSIQRSSVGSCAPVSKEPCKRDLYISEESWKRDLQKICLEPQHSSVVGCAPVPFMCMHSKEPHMYSKEPCIHSIELCIHSKEPYIPPNPTLLRGWLCACLIYMCHIFYQKSPTFYPKSPIFY